MLPITLEFIENGQVGQRCGWKITQGDKQAESLTWEEMLGVVVSLSLQPHDRPPCLHWMETREQREAFELRLAQMAERSKETI